MDEYQSDLSMDDHLTEDPWYGEDEIALVAVPNDLWSDCPLDKHPEEPEQWIDGLAAGRLVTSLQHESAGRS